MREQFRVDLRGLVEVLSHHLYALNASTCANWCRTRRHAVADRVEPATTSQAHRDRAGLGTDPLILRDNGIGLTADDMRTLLVDDRQHLQRDDFAMARRDFLGQFGIGLLSAFLVADSIEVPSRSARTGRADAALVGQQRRNLHDTESANPLPEPGTECDSSPLPGLPMVRARQRRRVREDFADSLDVAVRIRDTVVSQKLPPWKLTTDEQARLVPGTLRFEAMGTFRWSRPRRTSRGWLSVPYTARPGYRTGDGLLQRHVVAERNDVIVPRWRSPAAPSSTRANFRSPRRARACRSRARCSSPASGWLPPVASSSSCTACTPTSSTRSSRCAPKG